MNETNGRRSTAYYNEHDANAAQWLRNLIAAGHIAPGDVDDRDVQEVTADDVRGYGQVHLFAGIGGWSYALRLAGWPDDRPCWTGSCPCQPFSAAGKRAGTDDARHLWPEFRRLVDECRPAVCFGEQVGSRLGRQWLAGVRADLEELGYAVGAADLPAASVGAPHIRQRLWWVADADDKRQSRKRALRHCSVGRTRGPVRSGQVLGGMADAERSEWGEIDSPRGTAREHCVPQREKGADRTRGGCKDGGMADASGVRREEHEDAGGGGQRSRTQGSKQRPWERSRPVPCFDGKERRVGSGVQPLAHGVPARVGQLRAYGNAIVPQVAAAFVQAAASIISE